MCTCTSHPCIADADAVTDAGADAVTRMQDAVTDVGVQMHAYVAHLQRRDGGSGRLWVVGSDHCCLLAVCEVPFSKLLHDFREQFCERCPRLGHCGSCHTEY